MTHLVSLVQSRFGPRSYFKIFGSRNSIWIFHFQKIFRPSGVAVQKTLTVPHLPHSRDSTLGMQPIWQPLPVQPVIQPDHQRTIQSMFFFDASPQAYCAVAPETVNYTEARTHGCSDWSTSDDTPSTVSSNKPFYLWSDSQIVLHWLTTNRKLKTFERNRVTEIQELTESRKWNYCPTDQNPADLLTRGIAAHEYLESKLWKNGPDW